MCMEAVQIGEKLGFNLIFVFFYRWGEGEGSCSFPVGSQCHMNVQWLLHLLYTIKFTMLHTWLIFFFHGTLVHNALYLIISDGNNECQHYDLHWGPTDLLSYIEYWVVHWQSGQYCNGVSRHQSIRWLTTCQLVADFHTQSTDMQLTLSSSSLSADNLINVGSLQHQYITNGSPTEHWHITDTCLTRGVDRRRGPHLG